MPLIKSSDRGTPSGLTCNRRRTLPDSRRRSEARGYSGAGLETGIGGEASVPAWPATGVPGAAGCVGTAGPGVRAGEHTPEHPSPMRKSFAVFCLLKNNTDQLTSDIMSLIVNTCTCLCYQNH